MDTTVLLLKREEIQQRMALRRQDAAAGGRKFGMLPWVLKTGASLVGLTSRGSGSGWLWSLAGTLLVPLVLKAVGPKNDTFLHKLLHTVLPGHFAKDRSI